MSARVSSWLVHQQALEAIRNGLPAEADRLMQILLDRQDKRAWKLRPKLIDAYVRRAEQRLRLDEEDGEAAWDDLLKAERYEASGAAATALRERLTRLGMAQLRAVLEHGLPGRAAEIVESLQARNARHADLPALARAAGEWCRAAGAADDGDFQLALQSLTAARESLVGCPPAGLDAHRAQVERRQAAFRVALLKMQEAERRREWAELQRLTEEAAAAAPRHAQVRHLRANPWQSPAERTVSHPGANGHAEACDTPADLPVDRAGAAGHLKRFLLWVDGVGGYLVCLSPRVSLGRAGPEGGADVPLVADVARFHARLSRDSEGHSLHAERDVLVNGGRAAGAVSLSCGDQLTLGPTCQFTFRRAVPLSLTAALVPASGHRPPLGVDAVLLMADHLILGPPGAAHVPIRGMPAPVVIAREADGRLAVNFPKAYCVEDVEGAGRRPLPVPASVAGDEFSFTVEAVPDGVAEI